MIALLKQVSLARPTAPLVMVADRQAPRRRTYPTRNITLVLPFAAGSGTDTTTRLIGKEVGNALGVSMVIDNKAGANGSIAASYVARQPADGYTLFVTTNTTHSANPYLLKNMTYDPMKDFTPIARTGDLPFMLVIHPDIPANSVAELIALAKKEPGKYSYASGSSSAIVSGATFARLAGIDLLHVPYKSSPPALTDLIAGRVSMMFIDVPTGLPHVNAKALKALAVTTKRTRRCCRTCRPWTNGEGFRHHLMAGLPRPGQHAEGHRHAAERRNPQGDRAAGYQEPARRARHGSVFRHAGRVRGVREGTARAVGEADRGRRDREAVGTRPDAVQRNAPQSRTRISVDARWPALQRTFALR